MSFLVGGTVVKSLDVVLAMTGEDIPGYVLGAEVSADMSGMTLWIAEYDSGTATDPGRKALLCEMTAQVIQHDRANIPRNSRPRRHGMAGWFGTVRVFSLFSLGVGALSALKIAGRNSHSAQVSLPCFLRLDIADIEFS
jgi:hypothetical protein